MNHVPRFTFDPKATRSGISIIIPCLNEETHIKKCVDSALAFAAPSDLAIEVVVLDGMSTDQTWVLLQENYARHPRVKLIRNPGRSQSAALNLALPQAEGEWIMRLDAHSFYPPDYLEECLATARRTGADNVGGLFITLPGGDSYEARLVQAMTTHKFGVGNSGFRVNEGEGPADTVPYGFYRREVFDRLGGFDERLLRAQDYEFNRRILAQGGQIWRNPRIQVHYHNQRTLAKFYRKQLVLEAPYNAYLWYVAPYAFAWRHGITGAFTAGVLAGAILSKVHLWLATAYFSVLGLYCILAILSAAQQAVRYREILHFFCLPPCFFLYHFLHGLGVLFGLARLATGTAPVQRVSTGVGMRG